MFGKASPGIKNPDLQQIDRIAQYGQHLRCKIPVAEVGEECHQRKSEMCKPNFILVIRFVGFPSQTPGIAFVKYKMACEAEETDNPYSIYGDCIECGISISAGQLVVAEEDANDARSYPQCCDDMRNHTSSPFDGTNITAALEQMLIAAL